MNLPAAAVIPTEQAAHDATQPPTHHATESTAHASSVQPAVDSSHAFSAVEAHNAADGQTLRSSY